MTIWHEEKKKKEKKVPISQSLNQTQEAEDRIEVMETTEEVRATEVMTTKMQTEKVPRDKEIRIEEELKDKETSEVASREIIKDIPTETLKVSKDRVRLKSRQETDLSILILKTGIHPAGKIINQEIKEMISLTRIKIRMRNLLHKDREDLKRVLKGILSLQWTVLLLKRPLLQG